MKIAVLGATGGTGREIVIYALSLGYDVRALARNPAKMDDIKNENLTVVQGDAFSVNDLCKLMQGTDVVLSALGGGSFREHTIPTTFYSTTAENILNAMKKVNVKRLLAITSSGVEHDAGAPWWYRKIIRKMLMPAYKDMYKMELLLENTPELDWTLVRPSYMQNNKSKEYRVNDRLDPVNGWTIGRIDTAKFMVDEASANQWVHKHPALAY